MDKEEKINKLCEQLEKDAKKLGYQLEGMTLYNLSEDRHQINWNDKAKTKEKTGACEGLATCLIMLAEGDIDLIISSLKIGSAPTPYWRKFLDPAPFVELANKACDVGIETGEKILNEFQEVINDLLPPDQPIKTEGKDETDKEN